MASYSERRRQGRRQAMAGLAAAPFVGLMYPALSQDRAAAGQDRQAIAALQSGGLALIRHAITVPGVGDPPNFRLGDCSTQRNLSPLTRSHALWPKAALQKPAANRSGLFSPLR